MSSNIGSASLLIVPTFDGLSAKVDAALSGSSSVASKSGAKLGQNTAGGFGKGLAASGAVIGAFSSITNAAMSSISSHVDSAVARFDTLNNYPKVMQSLGYSAKDANDSISLMSDRLSTLPTRLDAMASTVQGIVAVTGDLSQATNAGLALNDMLLASGSSTQLVSAATEQFRQILSKGKPDMQDWKSLTQAMPGQMNQLAEAMLGAGHSASDLYYALGGGKASDAPEGIEYASISMTELLDAIIKLDQEGGNGITSFKEQAETAAGGISTSMSNLSNAVTKGITGVLDTIGKENIATVFNDMKGAVNSAFSVVKNVVAKALPYVQQFYNVFKSNSGTILTAVGTFAGLTVGADAVRSSFSKLINVNTKTKTGWDTIKSGASDLGTSFSLLSDKSSTLTSKIGLVGSSVKTMGSGVKGVLTGLISSINPVELAITGVSAAISIGVAAYEDWKQKTETLEKATSGLNEAVARSGAIQDYKGTIEGVGTVSGTAAKSVDELATSIAKSVDTMNENTAKAEQTCATLNTAQNIIEKYAGKTDLSSEAQGKLKWAIEQVNEQLGLNISQTDVANNKYTDQNGEVQDLTQSLSELIAKKKEEAQVEAITANLTEAYANRSEAAKTLAQAQTDLNNKAAEYIQTTKEQSGVTLTYDEAIKALTTSKTKEGEAYNKAVKEMEAASNAVSAYEDQLGRESAAIEGVTDKLSCLSDEGLVYVQGALSNTGHSISDFSASLDTLGVSTETLKSLTNEQLMQLASDYDGTTQSIAADLASWGKSIYDVADSTGEMAGKIAESLNSVSGLGDTISGLGWNMDEFAQKCSDAGLTTEDFAGVTTEQFAALAQSCNGNIDEMVNSIAYYNSTPLVDKDGTVNIDDNTLVDANGHILTYNGYGLYDKTAKAYVDSATVKDSTGVVWEWDGTKLVSKEADATIKGNAVTGDAKNKVENTQKAIDSLRSKTVEAQAKGNASDGTAASNIWNTVSAISSLAGKTITNTINTIKNTFTNRKAAGGIRLHAEGGIRKHAGGAIVNVPGTGIPLDVVGEDGAEAIVPLTNKRYVTPFARSVAEQMVKVTGTGTTQVVAEMRKLRAELNSLSQPTYNINGVTYDDGTSTANAIKDLTRAIKLERRA